MTFQKAISPYKVLDGIIFLFWYRQWKKTLHMVGNLGSVYLGNLCSVYFVF